MLPRTYDAQTCSVARTLEIVGERWTLLILRDAFLGIRRFDDFQTRLSVSRTVLAGRLGHLVEMGLMTRDRYQQRPDRFEYALTQKGLDLWPALNALRAWGDAYASPDGAPRAFVHEPCGTAIEAAAFCSHCQAPVPHDEVLTSPGPGYQPLAGVTSPLADALRRPRHLAASVREPTSHH